jgi:hypothetical protein
MVGQMRRYLAFVDRRYVRGAVSALVKPDPASNGEQDEKSQENEKLAAEV